MLYGYNTVPFIGYRNTIRRIIVHSINSKHGHTSSTKLTEAVETTKYKMKGQKVTTNEVVLPDTDDGNDDIKNTNNKTNM